MADIKTLIDENKVMMFSKGYCPFCTQAKNLLKSKNIDFKVIEMDEIQGGDQMHAALKAFSGQNTVPNTYVGGVHIGGCDDLRAKAGNGKLKEALDAAGVSYSGL